MTKDPNVFEKCSFASTEKNGEIGLRSVFECSKLKVIFADYGELCRDLSKRRFT